MLMETMAGIIAMYSLHPFSENCFWVHNNNNNNNIIIIWVSDTFRFAMLFCAVIHFCDGCNHFCLMNNVITTTTLKCKLVRYMPTLWVLNYAVSNVSKVLDRQCFSRLCHRCNLDAGKQSLWITIIQSSLISCVLVLRVLHNIIMYTILWPFQCIHTWVI